jgi:hypothetical protein
MASAYWSAWTIAEWWALGQPDWSLLVQAGRSIAESQNPYLASGSDTAFAFRWSPLMAWALWAIAPIGPVAWAFLHVAALTLLRNWKVAAVVGLSWPFLSDMIAGNLLIFVVISGWWALRGNRWGILAYLLFTVLIPRPIMLPLLAWLLWKHPQWRWPFVGIAVASVLAALGTGWGVEWSSRLITSGGDIANPVNIGPSRFIGAWWMLAGVPLAAWLTWKDRVGWASLAISPYLLPPYLLFAVLEVQASGRVARRQTDASE